MINPRKYLSRGSFALIVSLLGPALFAQNAPDVEQKIRALERQTQKHLQDQKPQLAIPLLREIVSLDPKNLNGQGNLGVLLFFQGDYAEAIPHMRAALELQPGLWRIGALLGIAEKRTGNPGAAQDNLERAFPNLDEKNIRIQAGLELIDIYSASGQLGKALPVIATLEDLAPENPQVLFVAYHLSRRLMDQSLLSMMIGAPDSAEIHMMMAGELARQGRQTDAIAQYREAIRLNPMLPGAHFELAEQLRISTDPASNAQAEDEYRAAIKVNQYDEKAWCQLAGLMAESGNFKAAEENYRKALALKPNDSEAKAGLANVLTSTDRTNEAVSLLESAVKDDPANIAAHYRLSMLYRRSGREADSQRELNAYTHYKEMREKLDTVFRRLGGAVRGNAAEPDARGLPAK